MQPVKFRRVLQHLSLRLFSGRPLGQVSYCQHCSLNTPPPPLHTHTPSRPLLCPSAKRAINTPPPTACTHVMEGKKGGEEEEEEDSKGKEGMLEGEEGGEG